MNDELVKKHYLIDTQIEAIREEIDRIEGAPSEYAKLLSMVDHYVRVNETADEKYLMLFQCLANFERLSQDQLALDLPIVTTLPLLSGICLFDLLILVGVITTEEMGKAQDAYLSAYQQKKGTPQA